MDGGAFQPFVTDTAATSATFTGVSGHTYGFYSVATDNSRFVQVTPTVGTGHHVDLDQHYQSIDDQLRDECNC